MTNLLRAAWTIAAMLGIALPVAAAPPDDAHHAQPQASAPQGVSSQHWQQMQGYMSAMRTQMSELHQATEPKERERLLHEHMQTMQSMMGLMQSLGGGMMGQMKDGHMHGHMGAGQTGAGQLGGDMMQMQNRMDMMQMMMQQMMEQMQGQMGIAGGSR